MYTMRDFLGFFLGAAITAALIVLLLPPSPCGGVVPAGQELQASSDIGSQLAADPSMKKLDKVQATNKDNLVELLRSAAMEDGTIIMTFTNEAWTLPGSLLDVFLESFRVGVKTQALLKHLVIVAIDGKAFERCQHVHPLCYSLAAANANFTAEQPFMSKDYLDMMWTRNKFQARVLALGHGFVFTDVDIVWFRNPLLRIPVAADIAVSCDAFYGESPYDLNKSTNGGFLYAKPSDRTLAFFRDWYEAGKRFPWHHDQTVFDQVKHDLAARHSVMVQYVDTIYLGSQCQPRWMDYRNLCTFHANCLIGLHNKTERLVGVLDEWKRFKAEKELLGSNSTMLVN
uniref:Uncharacterized protein n=1 Tax=Avena sativa TaxID=4498 RepID=A0ACD5YEJ0_AVESA